MFDLSGIKCDKNNSLPKNVFLKKKLDSSMGNLILINSAFWIFYLCPVAQKLLVILFLSWFELKSELGNIWIKFNGKFDSNQFSLLNFYSMYISLKVIVDFVFFSAGLGWCLSWAKFEWNQLELSVVKVYQLKKNVFAK